MPKATLLQRLLNNPSQSYSFPPSKDYHSTKPVLFKIATGGDLCDKSISVDCTRPARATSNFQKGQIAPTITLTPNSEEAFSHQLPVDGHGDYFGLDQDNTDNIDIDSDSEHEQFYTPRSSFYPPTPPPELSYAHLPVDALQAMPTLKLTKLSPPTHSEEWVTYPSRTSSSSSLESVSLAPSQDDIWSETTETAETHSIFSSSLTTSTRATTPVNSDHGHSKGSSSSGLSAISMSSTSSHVHIQKSSKRAPSRKTTYTDEDWAKEVRWLVTPDSSIAPKATTTKHSRSGSAKFTRATPLPLSLPNPPKSVKSRKNGKGKGRMTAVLEVSEDEDAAPSTYSRMSSSNISYARRNTRLQVGQHSLRISSQSRSGSGSQGQQSRRSPSPSRRYRTVLPAPIPVLASSEAPALPSRGTTPYSSLTLPRASTLPPSHAVYSSSARKGGIMAGGASILDKLKIEDSGNIDLTKSGMASTTMATVEVVKGSAETLRGREINRSFSWRVRSQIKNVKRASSGLRDRSHSPTPPHLLSGTPSPLGFCSHHPPPTYVPSNHLLVQVWAVGLDRRDGIIVRKEKTGFIPGRSFVGRVIETGWEVPEDFVRKGEWVVGLTDVKKCGALSEFLVVERFRVHRVPQPASASVPSDGIPHTSMWSILTVEELSLLPLCGVFAYRAVKTFEKSAATSVAASLQVRKRVLVLEGHEGSGALSVQMLVRKGWNVVVQVPPHAIMASGRSLEAVERRLRSWGVEEIYSGDALDVLRRILERCETEGYVVDGVLDTIGGADIWSASQQVLQRAPEPSIQDIQGSERSEFVVPPQFTTLVGDEPERPVPTAQGLFKAGLRSLKRAMIGNGVACAYSWVSVGADIDGDGLDVRDALAGIIKWVEDTQGAVKPWIGEEQETDPERRLMSLDGKIVVFEKTPRVFAGTNTSLSNGGTVVIKIVG